QQTALPNLRYMDSQTDLAWRARGILTDWLILQADTRFHLLPETLYLAVNIIGRVLSTHILSHAN
ncbi:hypothetical protein EDB85DRAFT_1864744, partial [Lactarius pseudohatsudake]